MVLRLREPPNSVSLLVYIGQGQIQVVLGLEDDFAMTDEQLVLEGHSCQVVRGDGLEPTDGSSWQN